MSLKLDSEVTLSAFIGFTAFGKILVVAGTWIGVHAEILAGISYILASAAAALTFYKTWTKK